MWFNNILALIIGGSIGTLLRYGIFVNLSKYYSTNLPVATIIVNLLGSFIIGFLWSLDNTNPLSPLLKNFLFIGLLGSFTTFSTFSLDIFLLNFNDNYFGIIKYILISNIGGIALVFAGVYLGRHFF